MVVIEQKAELIKQDGDPYELIENIARTCYKSDSRGDAKGFVLKLHKAKHDAMLEHAYIYFIMDRNAMRAFTRLNNANIKFLNIADDYVSGSFRAWLEFFEHESKCHDYETEEMYDINKVIYKLLADKYRDLFSEYVPDVSRIHYEVHCVSRQELINNVISRYDKNGDWILCKLLPHTFRFTTNRAISHELVRMRLCSFAEMSQRYVDFNGKDIEFIKPYFGETDILNWEHWNYAMIWAETTYHNLRAGGVLPQIARGVLPNDCATEIVVTATEEEWQHIVNLRYHGTTGAPHPQMKELIGLIYPTLQKESNGRKQ